MVSIGYKHKPHLKLLLNLRTKAITSYFCLHHRSDFITDGFILNELQRPRDSPEFGFRVHTLWKIVPLKSMYQKQQWTLLQNPSIIQKTEVRSKSWHCSPFLFFSSLIPPTPHIAPLILKSNAFCHLLLCLHYQLPPRSPAPVCFLSDSNGIALPTQQQS